MKKLKIVILALTLIILASCSTSATYLASKVYIGMSLSDFLALSNGQAEIDSMKDGYTIYRANDTNMDGWTIKTKFFYFNSNGILVQMDGGVRK